MAKKFLKLTSAMWEWVLQKVMKQGGMALTNPSPARAYTVRMIIVKSLHIIILYYNCKTNYKYTVCKPFMIVFH